MSAPCVIALAETGSTNTDAMARALAGANLPFWVIAERQTAGRGRSGRSWQATPGNFQASYAVHSGCAAAVAPQMSLVAGVAVHDALLDLGLPAGRGAAGLRLKWPNDILADGAKCGGILVETAGDHQRGGRTLVIGVGLNLVSSPELTDRAVQHLSVFGVTLLPHDVLRALATRMDEVMAVWADGLGFPIIRERWLRASVAPQTRMSITASGGVVEGTFEGIDGEGHLMLRNSEGRCERFSFGDVTLL